MSDLVEDFGMFLQQYEVSKPGGLLHALLDQMKPETARQFRLCAIPHQFSAEILQVLVPDLNDQAAAERCREFAQNPSVRSYGGQLFAVVKDWRGRLFDDWLKPEKRTEFVEANKRLVNYFSNGAEDESADADSRRLNKVFHLIGVDLNEGFAEFENLLGERRQRSSPGECEILIRLAREYQPVLTDSQSASLTYQEAKLAMDLFRTDEARRLFENVLLVKDVDPLLKIKTVARLGLLEHEVRNWSAAIARFNQALGLLDTIKDPKLQQTYRYRLKLNLGVTYREMGELQQAKRILLESVHQAHRAESPSGRAVAYNSLGTLFRKVGEGKTAIKAYTKALEFLDREKELYRVGQVYNNLGLAYIDERQWKKGEEALQESLKIKRNAGDTIGLGKTYNNLMQVYRVQKMEQEAVDAALKAIECFRNVGDYYDLGLAARNLGRLYRALGKKQEAVGYLQQAIELFEKSKALGEAQSLKEEVQILTLGKKRKLPWWTWLLYVVAGLVILVIVSLLLLGLVFVFVDTPGENLGSPGLFILLPL
jgi:tetratricopeptide (TPR) repeat protein